MDDTISRQAAIDAMLRLEQEDIEAYGVKIPEGFDAAPAVKALNELPSAQPEITGADVQEYCRKRNLTVITNELLHEMQRRWSETAQPGQKIEELLPDGTLHLITDADLSKVGRVLVSQNGTHYGALYYADGEPKRGKWILKPNIHGVAYCSECDYELHTNNTNYCPNCGADMRGEKDG